ncbi:Protein prenyltransferases alpha subunit repeat [Carpediemonas membranifera]|uniref:Protein farnesyltransferase/geranylgeranyltransferase type-1 subunit alpha n=1 Tax=Carpediemonas membranifera TaxID=201153 RepID=A0A8J6AY04_9EUKA|nr:Protein prenyltransferases alpha subunit repeat [Carpediemonas membranifera]|eukprot:KAG9394260.1 Protein prenyltransferases alpha subunit repeat [Carpediemonas membranifera]
MYFFLDKDMASAAWKEHDWSDVTPVEIEIVPSVCNIRHPAEYKEMVELFAAIVDTDEASKRVLDLSTAIIMKNPAHYSAWAVRRRCIFPLLDETASFEATLGAETDLLNALLRKIPKIYQTWNHRERVFDKVVAHVSMEDPASFIDAELDFIIDTVLTVDAKNYHAWSYLHHIVSTQQMWSRLSAVASDLIAMDVRNNSAWSFMMEATKHTGTARDDLVDALEYAATMARTAPNNECPWTFIRGLIDIDQTLQSHPATVGLLAEYGAVDGEGLTAVPALALRVGLLQDRTELGPEDKAEGKGLCQTLAKMDPIHSGYWTNVEGEFE